MGFIPRPAGGPISGPLSVAAAPPLETRGHALASLPLYGATLFLGAGLLFLVQPMFAKMVLPLLGGAPAVWNTAMVFFQSCLLAGYVYAHLLTRNLPPAWQAAVHLAVLAAAFATLPIAVASGWSPPAEGAPVPWLIGLMAVSIGLPFFAVSATAPLLQRWFAQSGHAAAKDPYFLYGASNLGSMAALLAYPLLVEPALTVARQAWMWAAGYGALAALIAACAFGLRRSTASAPTATVAAAPPTWRTRLHWLALAIVPSSLLLGVTTHISTDVAAIPLLWVAPLALYLLTFVIVFARKPLVGHNFAVMGHTIAVSCLVLTFWLNKNLLAELTLHMMTFFITALMCHGELARRRPDAGHLTEFYLWMSLGGVVGGAFNGLLAPVLFPSVYEYPLALALACLLRPLMDTEPDKHGRLIDIVLPLVLFATLLPPNLVHGSYGLGAGVVAACVYAVYAALAIFSFRQRPLRFALGVMAALTAPLFSNSNSRELFHERSFFGVSSVNLSTDGAWHYLRHGTTLHGAQSIAPARWREPQTYYSPQGPVGQIFAALAGRQDVRHVGVIGLGTGSVACYRQPGQKWTFYEIDPSIDRLARDSRYFHYLSECTPEARTVLGDARLSLAHAAAGDYDVLILDAFSSDAIPMHLLTREALALYLAKLSPGGILAVHVSNRHLDLEPVVARLAADAGLASLIQSHHPQFPLGMETASVWVAMARTDGVLESFRQDGRWRALANTPGSSLWTDDFSNILNILKF